MSAPLASSATTRRRWRRLIALTRDGGHVSSCRPRSCARTTERRARCRRSIHISTPPMVASFPRTFVELATGELPVEAAANVRTWFNTGDGAHYGHIRRLVTLGRRPAGLIKPWLLPEQRADEPAMPGSQFIDGLGSS